MTNTTTQLSGLELRKQVGLKIGYSEELTVENTHRGKKPFRIIWKPDGSMLNATVAVSDSLEGWRVVPAFEKDLGALQAAGIIDHEYLDLQRITREFYLDYPGQRTSEALAAWICRAFLSLPAETK